MKNIKIDIYNIKIDIISRNIYLYYLMLVIFYLLIQTYKNSMLKNIKVQNFKN